MCDIKKPFEQVAAQDSRNLADLFNKVGFQGAEDEAKHNARNPGRAITKASINAALWYLGGAAGDALGGGGGAAANAGATAGETTADALAASQAFGNMAGATTEQLMQQAIQNAALEQAGAAGGQLVSGAAGDVGKGLLDTYAPKAFQGAAQAAKEAPSGGLLSNAAYRALVPGVNPEQAQMLAAQTGDFGPEGLGMTMQSAGTAQGLSPAQQALAKYGGNYLGANAGTSGKVGNLALQMGLKSLQPQQQQRPGSPPPQQGPITPLPMPYQNGGGPNSLQGQQPSSLGNMPPPGMSYAEWLRRKQMGLI
jgi:hypothetical protein